MRRPIFIISIGFIIGIIGGILFNKVPFLFLLLIFINLFFTFGKIKYNNYLLRLVYLENKMILIFLVSAFIASVYLCFLENRYNYVYNNMDASNIFAIVESDTIKNEYKNVYKIKVVRKINSIYFLLKLPKSIKLEYGDKIQLDGEYVNPVNRRNYMGFNYKNYLKTQKVYGIIEADKVTILEHFSISNIKMYSNFIKNKIIYNVNQILPEETRNLLLGILIGFDDELQENIKESFSISGLSHLLAVSGAHIGYIIIWLNYILKKLYITKRIRNNIIIIFLIFFMYLTGLSSSVVRASIMSIIILLTPIIYRKSDIINTMSISILIILINNPYKILDISLILSYFATIGIIIYSKIFSFRNKDNNIKDKIKKYINELIGISIFANIFVLPIMIYNFNTITLAFILSNVMAGIIIGPIIIGGFLLVIISFINIKIASIISISYNLLLNMLIFITNLISNIPLAQIVIPTPNIIFIIFYYIILFIIFFKILIQKELSNRFIVKKILSKIMHLERFIKKRFKLILSIVLIIIILTEILFKILSSNFKMYFIDVGQGDSTLIITPTYKNILIDGGGTESSSFNVGESVLFPYLLDRRIIKLDYVFISHFDSDHCRRVIIYYE